MIAANYKFQRKSGFTRPPNYIQIASYLFVLYFNFIFWFIIFPEFEEIFQIINSIIFSLFFFLLVIFTFLTGFIDPTDPTIQQFYDSKKNNTYFEIKQQLFCEICDSYVQTTAKHCFNCDRCVNTFDHHCIWVNNCIGAINFKYYCCMISFCWLFLLTNLIYFSIGLYLIITNYIKSDFDYLNKLNITPTQSIIIISIGIFISFTFFLFISHLSIRQIWLYFQNLTTYEYIVQTRERKAQEELLKIQQQEQKKLYQLEKQKELQQSIQKENSQQETIQQHISIQNQQNILENNNLQEKITEQQHQDINNVKQDQKYIQKNDQNFSQSLITKINIGGVIEESHESSVSSLKANSDIQNNKIIINLKENQNSTNQKNSKFSSNSLIQSNINSYQKNSLEDQIKEQKMKLELIKKHSSEINNHLLSKNVNFNGKRTLHKFLQLNLSANSKNYNKMMMNQSISFDRSGSIQLDHSFITQTKSNSNQQQLSKSIDINMLNKDFQTQYGIKQPLLFKISSDQPY